MNQQQIGYGNFAFENDEARLAARVKWGFMQLKYGPTGGPPKKEEAKKDNTKPVPNCRCPPRGNGLAATHEARWPGFNPGRFACHSYGASADGTMNEMTRGRQP